MATNDYNSWHTGVEVDEGIDKSSLITVTLPINLDWVQSQLLAGVGMLHLEARIDLPAHKAICIHGGKADLADNVLGRVAVGVSTMPVMMGSLTTIQTGGIITIPGAGFTMDQELYLGADGVISNASSHIGISQRVGIACAVDQMVIRISQHFGLVV